MSSGLVFDIRKFAVRDGPGIRTAVFLKGCPLRCLWCHNPEGIAPEPELLRRPERCVAAVSRGLCGRCARACPESGFDPRAGAGSAECARCATLLAGEEPPCAAACPAEAFSLVGRRMEAEAVAESIGEDAAFYEESGGGATFTGGEPLMQGAFLLELLEGCRDRGIRTAVDTSGWAERGLVMEAARLADLFLFDLKLVDDARHRAATGVPSGPILANLEALARARARLRIRVPLVPGVNDSPGDLAAAARLAAALSAEAGGWEVDILPYHDAARGKYRMRGEEYRMEELRPPSEEEARRAAAVFEREGLVVGIGGAR